MTLIWLGVILVIGGVIFTAAQPMLRGRLSRLRRVGPTPSPSSNTLEPEQPGLGLSLRDNWPGLLMIALGAVLLLSQAAFS